MNWITREHVKVDRVACPWLIKKFVDPQAEFLFVPPEKVMEVVPDNHRGRQQDRVALLGFDVMQHSHIDRVWLRNRPGRGLDAVAVGGLLKSCGFAARPAPPALVEAAGVARTFD